MKQIAIMLAVVVALVGCVTYYHATYQIPLVSVERPEDAADRYGAVKIETVDEGGVTKYGFSDDLVSIVWNAGETQFDFVLSNKTDHSIKIIWDEAAFIDRDGTTSRVMHTGVKYVDRNNSQPPTVVPRGGTVTDVIVPTDRVYYSSSEYGGGWNIAPMLPITAQSEESMQMTVDELKGKTIQILLPLGIEDVVNEYIFVFRVDGANVWSM